MDPKSKLRKKRGSVFQSGILKSLGSLPDSPPDSGSEHLLSPANSHGRPQQQHLHHQPHHLLPMASSSNSPVHPQGGSNSLNNNIFFQEHSPYQTSTTTASPTYSQQQQHHPQQQHQQLQQGSTVSSFVGQHLHLYRPFPDLSTIDYSVPLQLIEQHQQQQQRQQTTIQALVSR